MNRLSQILPLAAAFSCAPKQATVAAPNPVVEDVPQTPVELCMEQVPKLIAGLKETGTCALTTKVPDPQCEGEQREEFLVPALAKCDLEPENWVLTDVIEERVDYDGVLPEGLNAGVLYGDTPRTVCIDSAHRALDKAVDERCPRISLPIQGGEITGQLVIQGPGHPDHVQVTTDVDLLCVAEHLQNGVPSQREVTCGFAIDRTQSSIRNIKLKLTAGTKTE